MNLEKVDTIKLFDQVYEPDPRQKAIVVLDLDTHEIRDRTLNDHYSSIDKISLDSTVPEEIRKQFDVARNLLLYSWFVYRFIPVAELHGYATVEFALREKVGESKAGLKKLLKIAVGRGLLKDKGFRVSRFHDYKLAKEQKESTSQPDINKGEIKDPGNEDVQRYCELLIESLPFLRNELAHGSNMVYPGGLGTLEICADLINQLFEAK